MINPIENQWSVTNGKDFKLSNYPTLYNDAPELEFLKKDLKALNKQLYKAQHKLWADNRFSILCVFQAMDAAGKDSTIRKVFTGVNPAGVNVWSFKAPNALELEHDFLWRTTIKNPPAGTIGVFNRSYYEEVLVVKVHNEYLDNQHLTTTTYDENFWQGRYESIRNMEKHLARSGTVVMKFFLNVSKREQRNRFISRLETPDKHWKFSKNDLTERQFWNDYMSAYEQTIHHTAAPHAPWYVIPADNKKVMQWTVAQTVLQTINSLPIRMPNVESKDPNVWQGYIDRLLSEDD